MTYGWAFLIIIVMVAALAYFGISNPSRLLPNRCNFGPEWECVDYQVSSSANTIRLMIKNNLGETVTIDNIAVGNEAVGNSVYCSAATPVLTGSKLTISNIRSGEAKDIIFSTCGMAAAGVLQGGKAKINVTIDYYPIASGSNYMKQTKGDLYIGVV
ncbi:MAG TPA: hypothetical protein VJI97_00210 [Candidatus Nanoarchaeia archaeon]|nr:hypothetical protein [Candidatus Nanoarchaeia archaeon]